MRMAITMAAAAAIPAAAATSAPFDFAYAYPAQAARMPALRAWLEADKARLRAATARDAAAAEREARAAGFPYHRYETTRTWKVVTDTPRLLSLSGEAYSYTGGAHGSPGTLALLWDKAAARRIDPRSLFTTPAAIEAALRPAWCRWLDGERERRLGVNAATYGPCPPLKDLTLLLGSSNGRRIDRVGLVADPYVAGSYVEGTYEMTQPVTPVLLRAVKPAWRTAVILGR